MDRVIEAIKQLIMAVTATESSLLEGVKTVYWGDPIQIPESNMPAICIQPVSTNYERRGSRYDRKTHLVDIIIVSNVKNYVATTPTDVTKVPAVEAFIDMAEKVGQDGKTDVQSISGIIQSNPRLPYTDAEDGDSAQQAAEVTNVSSVNYVFNSARGFPTFEVIITVEATVQGNRS